MTEGRKFVDRLTAVPLKNRFLSIMLCVCIVVGLVPMQAAAVTPGSTQINEKIEGAFIKAWKNGKTSFNINGIDGSTTYQTTFMNRGYSTAVSVDGRTKQSNPSNLIASGLRLDVDLSLYDDNDNYVMVQYTLTNNGARSHDVQVGSYADVMIDRNDRAPIYAETSGGNVLNMSGSPRNNYAFKLVATGCDTLWYGFYGDRFTECFTNMTDRGPSNKYNGDSALAYSWKTVVAPGETWTRCVLIGTGSLAQMNAEAPTIPKPDELIPDPAISLSTGEIYLTEGDDMPGWGDYITRLVGTVSTSGAPTNTNTTGTYNVTYTAKNNNKTAKATLKVNILPRPAELSKTTYSAQTNAFALSATMNYTGGLNWKETGFVYGVVSKPTLTQNDGTVKTSGAVSSKGGRLTAAVNMSSLVSGLQYYARAYAKASDGSVIYGDSSTRFGVGVPNYGTFSVINNNNNTFTISRDKSDGAQTVYYRTVNGSAVGGTHFKHAFGKLKFADGEKSKNVTVTENAVYTKYSNLAVTAYSNADRTYQLEIYRFDGWYTAASGGTKADNDTDVGSNYTLYAHWTHIDHSGGTATCKDKAVCATCGAEYGEIDSNNHDIVHYSAKAATCTENGWNAHDACSRCDYTTIKVIPALNHDFVNGVWQHNETQHWKKCSRCDETDTAKTNHTFGKWENGKRTCGVCGYEEASTVSVTITWSAMDFTYSDGTWDAKTHQYENSGWKPTQTNGNLITVKNDGESSINVTCNYTQKNTAISGSFSDGGAYINAPFALPSGNQKDLLLILSGKPAAAMNKSEIGEVTVKIGG